MKIIIIACMIFIFIAMQYVLYRYIKEVQRRKKILKRKRSIDSKRKENASYITKNKIRF